MVPNLRRPGNLQLLYGVHGVQAGADPLDPPQPDDLAECDPGAFQGGGQAAPVAGVLRECLIVSGNTSAAALAVPAEPQTAEDQRH